MPFKIYILNNIHKILTFRKLVPQMQALQVCMNQETGKYLMVKQASKLATHSTAEVTKKFSLHTNFSLQLLGCQIRSLYTFPKNIKADCLTACVCPSSLILAASRACPNCCQFINVTCTSGHSLSSHQDRCLYPSQPVTYSTLSGKLNGAFGEM